MKKSVYKKSSAAKNLPRRLKDDSKVQGGRVVVVAGSPGMWGAGVLAAQAASRSGAGYIHLLESTRQNLFKHPDFLTSTEAQLKKILANSAILGPGYRKPRSIKSWIQHWKTQKQKNVVLDAEALNWLAENPQQVLDKSWVLTPHEGEMARLLHKTRQWVRGHRQEAVLRAQKKWQCIVVLKGPSTLVADGEHLYSIDAGNPSLGKAGSGDVLSGMIAGFLAQRLATSSPTESICAAAFVHGWMADQWIQSQKDVLSLRPTDLVESLPTTLASLRKVPWSQNSRSAKK